MTDLITSIDGTTFAALILFAAAFFIYTANEIAKLGQHQEPRRTAPVHSGRKAGRRSA